jgi:hypothetical protein
MLETPEELDNLQRLLDRSMAGAGGHLRGIITGERRLSAAGLAGRLQGMRLLVVATVTADGRPLAGPVRCGCVTWRPGPRSAPPTCPGRSSR